MLHECVYSSTPIFIFVAQNFASNSFVIKNIFLKCANNKINGMKLSGGGWFEGGLYV